MEKLLKYLMLMLVATFSLTFVSCGGDDDDEPDNPNTQTSDVVTGDVSENYPVSLLSDHNFSFRWYGNELELSVYLDASVTNEKMASVGKVSKLDDIKIVPTSGWAPQQYSSAGYGSYYSTLPLVDNNGYVIMYTYEGKAYYIRLFITLNKSVIGETVGIHYQFQHFIPSNS